ncbi:hypothetical protein WA158_008538 [Blastocystis sp. Blastoise]
MLNWLVTLAILSCIVVKGISYNLVYCNLFIAASAKDDCMSFSIKKEYRENAKNDYWKIELNKDDSWIAFYEDEESYFDLSFSYKIVNLCLPIQSVFRFVMTSKDGHGWGNTASENTKLTLLYNDFVIITTNNPYHTYHTDEPTFQPFHTYILMTNTYDWQYTKTSQNTDDWKTSTSFFSWPSFSPGIDVRHDVTTVYFRTVLQIDSEVNDILFQLSIRAKSGIVIYIGGIEIDRYCIKSGNITSTTPGDICDGPTFDLINTLSTRHFTFHDHKLVIAVELHARSLENPHRIPLNYLFYPLTDKNIHTIIQSTVGHVECSSPYNNLLNKCNNIFSLDSSSEISIPFKSFNIYYSFIPTRKVWIGMYSLTFKYTATLPFDISIILYGIDNEGNKHYLDKKLFEITIPYQQKKSFIMNSNRLAFSQYSFSITSQIEIDIHHISLLSVNGLTFYSSLQYMNYISSYMVGDSINYSPLSTGYENFQIINSNIPSPCVINPTSGNIKTILTDAGDFTIEIKADICPSTSVISLFTFVTLPITTSTDYSIIYLKTQSSTLSIYRSPNTFSHFYLCLLPYTYSISFNTSQPLLWDKGIYMDVSFICDHNINFYDPYLRITPYSFGLQDIYNFNPTLFITLNSTWSYQFITNDISNDWMFPSFDDSNWFIYQQNSTTLSSNITSKLLFRNRILVDKQTSSISQSWVFKFYFNLPFILYVNGIETCHIDKESFIKNYINQNTTRYVNDELNTFQSVSDSTNTIHHHGFNSIHYISEESILISSSRSSSKSSIFSSSSSSKEYNKYYQNCKGSTTFIKEGENILSIFFDSSYAVENKDDFEFHFDGYLFFNEISNIQSYSYDATITVDPPESIITSPYNLFDKSLSTQWFLFHNTTLNSATLIYKTIHTRFNMFNKVCTLDKSSIDTYHLIDFHFSLAGILFNGTSEQFFEDQHFYWNPKFLKRCFYLPFILQNYIGFNLTFAIYTSYGDQSIIGISQVEYYIEDYTKIKVPDFHYYSSSIYFFRNIPISMSYKPTEYYLAYTLMPSLHPSMILDSSNGFIYGTPTILLDHEQYVLTVLDIFGKVYHDNITITISDCVYPYIYVHFKINVDKTEGNVEWVLQSRDNDNTVLFDTILFTNTTNSYPMCFYKQRLDIYLYARSTPYFPEGSIIATSGNYQIYSYSFNRNANSVFFPLNLDYILPPSVSIWKYIYSIQDSDDWTSIHYNDSSFYSNSLSHIEFFTNQTIYLRRIFTIENSNVTSINIRIQSDYEYDIYINGYLISSSNSNNTLTSLYNNQITNSLISSSFNVFSYNKTIYMSETGISLSLSHFLLGENIIALKVYSIFNTTNISNNIFISTKEKNDISSSYSDYIESPLLNNNKQYPVTPFAYKQRETTKNISDSFDLYMNIYNKQDSIFQNGVLSSNRVDINGNSLGYLIDYDPNTYIEIGPRCETVSITYSFYNNIRMYANSYYFVSPSSCVMEMPTGWKILGKRELSSDWELLDYRMKQTWSIPNEKRFYYMNTTESYIAYQLSIISCSDATSTDLCYANTIRISEWNIVSSQYPNNICHTLGDYGISLYNEFNYVPCTGCYYNYKYRQCLPTGEYGVEFNKCSVSPPSSFYYPMTTVYLYINVPMEPLIPTAVGCFCRFSSLSILPEGLSINNDTGIISGTPTTVSSSYNLFSYANSASAVILSLHFIVEAIYCPTQGEWNDTIGNTQVLQCPNYFTGSISRKCSYVNEEGQWEYPIIDCSLTLPSFTYTSVSSISLYTSLTIIPIINNSVIAFYSISPSLPSTLVFDNSTGVITGVITEQYSQVYTVIGYNSRGKNYAMFSINSYEHVNCPASDTFPALPVGYYATISCGLPFDLEGTISIQCQEISNNSYQIRILSTNCTQILPSIIYPSAAYGYASFPIAVINPSIYGRGIESLEAPIIPSSLSFDKTTGSISGTINTPGQFFISVAIKTESTVIPTSFIIHIETPLCTEDSDWPSTYIYHSITLPCIKKYYSGSRSRYCNILINPYWEPINDTCTLLPPVLTLSSTHFHIYYQHIITPIVPIIQSGDTYNITLSKLLPKGLTMNNITGIITGIPEEALDYMYIMTVSNAAGKMSVEFRLECEILFCATDGQWLFSSELTVFYLPCDNNSNGFQFRQCISNGNNSVSWGDIEKRTCYSQNTIQDLLHQWIFNSYKVIIPIKLTDVPSTLSLESPILQGVIWNTFYTSLSSLGIIISNLYVFSNTQGQIKTIENLSFLINYMDIINNKYNNINITNNNINITNNNKYITNNSIQVLSNKTITNSSYLYVYILSSSFDSTFLENYLIYNNSISTELYSNIKNNYNKDIRSISTISILFDKAKEIHLNTLSYYIFIISGIILSLIISLFISISLYYILKKRRKYYYRKRVSTSLNPSYNTAYDAAYNPSLTLNKNTEMIPLIE